MNTPSLFPELETVQPGDIGTDAGAIRRYTIVREKLRELIAARKTMPDADTVTHSEAIADALIELETMGANLVLELPSGALIKLH